MPKEQFEKYIKDVQAKFVLFTNNFHNMNFDEYKKCDRFIVNELTKLNKELIDYTYTD